MSKRKTLITDDMIKLVKSSLPNADIVKEDFDSVKSYTIGRATIIRNPDGKIEMHLDTSFDKDYQSIWKNDVGNILRKELHKDDPQIYVMSDGRISALLKRIDESEIDSFTENGFCHIIIGDNVYTLIRVARNEGDFRNRDLNNDYYAEIPIDDSEFLEDVVEEDEELESTELF